MLKLTCTPGTTHPAFYAWNTYERRIYEHARTSPRYWELFIPCVCNGHSPAVIERAAQIASQAERSGRPCGAWHAVHLAAGYATPCPCVPCSDKRVMS